MDKLREQALAKLSFAALCIDFLVCFTLWHLLVSAVFTGRTTFVMDLVWLPAVMIAHLFVVEVVLSGVSVGRLCCGLSVSSPDAGQPLSLSRRLKRFVDILCRLGLASFNTHTLPAHNRSEMVAFSSDLAGRAVPRTKPGEPPPAQPAPAPAVRVQAGVPTLVVTGGPHRGVSVALQPGQLNIGRTPGWARLVFDRDRHISARHCRIVLGNGRVLIADGADAGQPSSNGTYLNGRRISSDGFQPIPANASIQLGGTSFTVRL